MPESIVTKDVESMSVFAVVPVKTLLKSKTRLSTVLTLEERAQFTLAMLKDVLEALKRSKIDSTVVVSADPTVESLAKDFGMMFLWEKGEGLNQAYNQAAEWCSQKEAKLVLMLPADVPIISAKDIDLLVNLAVENSVVLSPSQNGGTNALLQTPPQNIAPCFGHDSFRKHVQEAQVKQVATKIYASSRVIFDIDTEKDLERLMQVGDQTTSHRLLNQLEWGKTHN